jgi:lambda repressor-like predicted transcriptional regulator
MYHKPHRESNIQAIRNLMAVQILRAIGFDQINILKALPKLTGLTHPEVARRLGISRSSVSSAISMERTNRRLQQQIAEAYDVPVEILFPESSAAA